LYQNTVSGYSFVCNGTSWIRIDDSTVPSGDDTFESVYANDGDSSLNTTNGAFTINTGTNDFIVDSADWNVDASGNLDANIITANGTLDANGVVTIGDNGDAITLDSSAWDINSAGVGSGFTGFTSTGTINFSGAGAFRLREVAGITNPGTACTTTGELIMDTNDNTLYVCTNAGTDAWSKVSSSGDATTLDTIDSTQFLRSDTSDNYTSGTLTLDNGTTLTVNGVANIGDNGDTVAIDSSDWDISTTGAMTGISGITNDSTFTTSGGAVSLNDNSNFAINIGTGTSTGAVSVGGGANTVAIDSSDWDISSTGAMTGISGITNDSTFSTSGGAVSLNNNSNFAVNIGTGTSTGAVGIGGGANTVAIDSSAWDISTAGVASGLTGLSTGGTVSLGNNTSTVAVDSSDWDISTTGAMTGIGAVTMDGLLTGTAGATMSGAAVSLNNNSNFATNIGTGTSTGAVSIGGNSNTVAIDSSAWDISTTGTASGLTLTAPKFADLGFIADANGNEMAIFDTVTSAVNEITMANAITGANPSITASGGDTNISLKLAGKGTGGVQFYGGTPIRGHISGTNSAVVMPSVTARACADATGTITVTGAAVGDIAIVSPSAVASGIETTNLSWSGYVSAANTVSIRLCNATNGAIDILDTQGWRADVWQH